MLARSLILKMAHLRPVERMVRHAKLFRPLVSRFIAGDTLEEAIAKCQEVLRRNIMVTLDILGENTHSEDEALEAKATYIRMLERMAEVPEGKHAPGEIEPLNISIKLTQCGLDMGDVFAEKNLRDVLDTAKRLGNFVRVDMEASDYTERTVALVLKMVKEYDNVGTVLQSYLYRTPQDVETFIATKTRIRLVKGAYLEPASVAHPSKQKVDQAFVDCAKRLMEAGIYPAIATHDEPIIRQLNAFAAEKGIAKDRFEYQMLYGIRRDLQESLVKEGYRVRVYVPFGDSWYPYFSRRLAERPANMVFIIKSLFKG